MCCCHLGRKGGTIWTGEGKGTPSGQGEGWGGDTIWTGGGEGTPSGQGEGRGHHLDRGGYTFVGLGTRSIWGRGHSLMLPAALDKA